MKISATTRQIRKKEKTIFPKPRYNNEFKFHFKLKGIRTVQPFGNDVPDFNIVKLSNNGGTSMGTLSEISNTQEIINLFGTEALQETAFNIAANRHKLGSSDQG
jgi:hypothetical protein